MAFNMYGPLNSIRSLFKKPKEKLLLCGLDACGKTTLLYRWKLDEHVRTIPTVGFNVEEIDCGNTTFTVWDVNGVSPWTGHMRCSVLTTTGCAGARPLFRHYMTNSNDSILFLHDCSLKGERLEESIEALHFYMKLMSSEEARMLFVAFSRQDLLPQDERTVAIADRKSRFQKELADYSGRISYTIIDIPGLSGATGRGCRELLNTIASSLNSLGSSKMKVPRSIEISGEKSSPSPPKASTEAKLMETIAAAEKQDLAPEKFWEQFTSYTKQQSHRDYLRAAFMVLLQAREAGRGILQAASILEGYLRQPDIVPSDDKLPPCNSRLVNSISFIQN
jgi:GTPase SAR1 family protein